MIMSYNWGKKALCFFVFAILCALNAYAESCSAAGNLRYSASGCSYNTEICCNGAWISGSTCSECASNTCWNGSSCASKGSTSRSCSANVSNASGGTQTRTATCKNGSGWSYGSWGGKCTCNSNYYWSSGQGSCISCGTPPNNGAPYQYNGTTSPTAAQYKANAAMCQFKVLCLDESGWRTDPGTGLDYCVCVGGYTWDSSSQSCKENASAPKVECSTSTDNSSYYYDSAASAISACNSGPVYTQRTGMLGAGYIEGTLSVSSCPGAHGSFSMTPCTASSNGNKYRYSYSTTVCYCR